MTIRISMNLSSVLEAGVLCCLEKLLTVPPNFYLWRSRITRRLIAEKGFSFVGVEGDWPDCYRINRYVRGYDNARGSAKEVFGGFERWPTWMWANWEVIAFCEWLKTYNDARERKAGFYGLDMYSLWESLEVILGYLEKADPEAFEAAKRAFACFEPYGENDQAYAWSTARLVPASCESEVIDLLVETRKHAAENPSDTEAAFDAEQNALVAVKAEEYYRSMMYGGADSWNLRDSHMMETLNRLMEHIGDGGKAIVWAHNTHVGDARATDMASAGMFNIGQLVRERYPGETFLIGFGGFHGNVIAGNSWGATMRRMNIPEALSGSWEDIFHRADARNRLLLLDRVKSIDAFLRRRGHRAIGVVYHPYAEQGNYVSTALPERYDAFLFFDETEALHPLHIEAGEKQPETYPWGL